MVELEILHSESLTAISAAYATAMAAIENVEKDRDVEVKLRDNKGKYTFAYATLGGILHHIRPHLTANGLWFQQYVRLGHMVTRLIHSSGEWMEAGAIPMPDFKGGPQDIGSIISYFKRYSLSAALGLASEEDNDGEQGEREVSFRARGGPAPLDAPQYDEPAEGWGDWARAIIAEVEMAPNETMLDTINQRESGRLGALYGVDRFAWNAIGKAVRDRKGVLNRNAPL